jgi:formamidopyrimidine-DNA glycosylase
VPELPEVETTRRSLAGRVVGRRIKGAIALPVRLRGGIVPADWLAHAVGATVLGLSRRGKYLLADLGRSTAVIHLGMSGRLAIVAAGAPCGPHTHLRLLLAGGDELRLVDPRRFGLAIVAERAVVAALPCLVELGVDALDGDVEPALVAAAARSRTPVRSLLLDQTVVAGIGNIYAAEALARAGIHPLRPASALARRRVRRLAAEVKNVLAEALAAGGTTLEDGGFADAAGNAGFFAVRLEVYGREGQPCTRCGASIRRQSAGGRSAFFCPRCQR